MRCSSCGSGVRTGDAFCPECGIRVSGKAHAAPPPPETPTEVVTPTPPAPATLPPEAVPPTARAKKKTSGFAIASLVLGIAAFTCLPVVSAILAIVFGAIAKGEIRRRGGELSGSGMATAGIVLGIVGLVIPLILAAVMVPIGVYYLWPKFEARGDLLKGVDAARAYYVQHDESYRGISAEALSDIDGAIDFEENGGTDPGVVYVSPTGDTSVMLYCYSRRGDRYWAWSTGNRWTYSFELVPFEHDRWWLEDD